MLKKAAFRRFSLVEKNDGVVVRLIDYMAPNLVVPYHVRVDGDSVEAHQPGGPGTHWRGVLAGWHYAANSLRDLVVGRFYSGDYDQLTLTYDGLLHRFQCVMTIFWSLENT